MDTIQSSRQHRTFARSNGLGSGAAIPHLAAAEERHRKNLQHIRQLKLTLCSTVSSAAPQRPSIPPSRGESLPSSSPSLPSPALQVWGGRGGALRDSSTGVVASRTTSALPPPSLPTIATNATAPPPQRARETPISAAALQSSQDEVEELVREKHRLQRQCVELASLLADTRHGGGASAALAAAGSATEDASAWSPVHDAAVAVVEQVARCYPDVVREWATATNGGDGAASSNAQSRLRNTAGTTALATVARDACSLPSVPGEASLTADELADALRRLADFLPQLASMTAVSKLVAEAGPDMLDHIHALEEEKRSDCVAVLSIADHLSTVSAQMRREAAEKDAALHALQQAVGDLLEEKQEWARRARASEAALAERYTQYRQREKAWEREVGELLQAKDSFAAAVPAGEVAARIEDATAATRAVAEEREAELQQQLVLLQKTVNESAADLGDMQEAHDALQATHAALQTSTRATIAAQQERIAVLEGQLHPLEAELRTQSDTISATLRKVEELTAAHGAEVSTLERTHQRVFAEKEAALAELRASKELLQAELAKVTTSVAQRTMELRTMTAARDALQTALEEREQISVADSASFFATASTPLRLTRVVDSSVDGGEATAAEESAMNSPSGLADEGDTEESGDALFRTTNVRKLQQSLKRMSRERVALKRKLEHRGAALAEMEAELEAAQRLVAQQETHAQVLQAELESVRATSATVAEAAEPVTAAAAPREEETPAQKQKEAMPATTPINWIAFSDLEEHAEEGTLYPDPVDLQEWLLNRRDPPRFADYVAHHLSHHDQLLVAAVGPLYHIGFNLLRAEGYLDDDLYFPVIWRRVLLQLQQVLDVQLEGLRVSAADCAHRFYALATAAGLFRALRDSSDVLTAYTLILASLSVCLGLGSNGDGEKSEKEEHLEPARSDPLPASESRFASPCGRNATKWQSCQAVLRHVCSQGDGEAAAQRRRSSGGEEGEETPFALLTQLAQQDVEAVSACSTIESDVSGFRRVEEGDSRSSAVLGMSTVATAAVTPTHRVEASPSHKSPTPWFTLASLLSHGLLTDVVPLSCYALQRIVLQQIVLSRTTAGDGTEHRLSSRTPTPPSPSSVRLTQVALLLYIARFELLLEGWTAARPAAAEEVVSSLPSIKSLGVVGGANCGDSDAGVLMLLDTGLLPAITMSISLCRCLEHEPHLLPAFFETRQAVLSSREAAAAQGEVLLNGVPLLSEAQLRDCVQQVLAPVKPAASTPSRVVQVPVAEYERLHRELLFLYQSNETYEAHLQELLGAVEGV